MTIWTAGGLIAHGIYNDTEYHEEQPAGPGKRRQMLTGWHLMQDQ